MIRTRLTAILLFFHFFHILVRIHLVGIRGQIADDSLVDHRWFTVARIYLVYYLTYLKFMNMFLACPGMR